MIDLGLSVYYKSVTKVRESSGSGCRGESLTYCPIFVPEFKNDKIPKSFMLGEERDC